VIEQFLPPTNATIDGGPHQVFLFLAGPIQGAADWQAEAYQHLSNLWKALDGILTVCNPRRKDDSQFQYAQQVDWETLHLHLAAQQGVILFWLAKENKHTCDRSYAQTTRFELGEWSARAPDSIVIGIEEGFTGAKYIRHRMPGTKIYTTLRETCEAAIQKTRLI
jgi:hypothetical protein